MFSPKTPANQVCALLLKPIAGPSVFPRAQPLAAAPFAKTAFPTATTLALAAALLFGGAQPVSAQVNDPFALPSTASIADAHASATEGPGLSAIEVNGQSLVRMVDLAWVDGDLAISTRSALMANIPLPDKDANPAAFHLVKLDEATDSNLGFASGEGAGGAMVKLKDLKIAHWSFDKLAQRLSVKLLRDGDGPNNIDFSRIRSGGGNWGEMGNRNAGTNIAALVVDYNFAATLTKNGLSGAGTLSPRMSFGNVEANSNFQFITEPEAGRSPIRRLDSGITLNIPRRGLMARVGDTISAGTQSHRPLRIGGLKIGTDFALRPDLVTAPLPAFEGNVSVPTGLDLIVNDQRFASNDLEAGRFQIRNIPISPGRGEVSAVIIDELGREVVQNLRIYTSRRLLAPRLWQGAANIGYIRRRYGQVSNDYRDLVGTFFVRRGFSKSLSFGLSGEAGLGLTNLGAQMEMTVFDRALLYSELRYSRTAQNNGFLTRFGVESLGEGVSIRAEAVLPSEDYRDLAAQAGDPLPARQFIAAINFDLRDSLHLQLTANRQERHFDPRYPTQKLKTEIARVTLRSSISKRIDLSGDVSYRRAGGHDVAFSLGASMRLGADHTVQGSLSRSNGRYSGQTVLFKPDMEQGDLGYRAEVLAAERLRLAGAVAWRSKFARFEGQAEYNGGELALRANANGTLLYADGGLYARNRTGGAFALVKTGNVGGVTVTRENRVVGVSDKNGNLLVENISPYVAQKFNVDPDALPLDAVVRSTHRRLIVARGGVARVHMDIDAYRSQLVRLVDFHGQPLKMGTQLTALPSGATYRVAYDGMIDFNALSKDTTLQMVAGGLSCQLEVPTLEAQGFDIPEIQAACVGVTIAAAPQNIGQSSNGLSNNGPPSNGSAFIGPATMGPESARADIMDQAEASSSALRANRAENALSDHVAAEGASNTANRASTVNSANGAEVVAASVREELEGKELAALTPPVPAARRSIVSRRRPAEPASQSASQRTIYTTLADLSLPAPIQKPQSLNRPEEAKGLTRATEGKSESQNGGDETARRMPIRWISRPVVQRIY